MPSTTNETPTRIDADLSLIRTTVAYTTPTIEPSQMSDKKDGWGRIHIGRAGQSVHFLKGTAKSADNIEAYVRKLESILENLVGTQGQWDEEWLNNLAAEATAALYPEPPKPNTLESEG